VIYIYTLTVPWSLDNGCRPLCVPELEPKFHEMPYLPDPYCDRTSNQFKPDTITSLDLGTNGATKSINNCKLTAFYLKIIK